MPTKKRNKITKEKKTVVKALVDAGVPYREIRKATDVSPTSITRIIKEFETNDELVAWFRENRANVFAHEQAQEIALINRVRGVKFGDKNLSDEDIIAMSTRDANEIMRGAALRFGIGYDKEEKERNKGVDDVSKVIDLLTRMKQYEAMQKEAKD